MEVRQKIRSISYQLSGDGPNFSTCQCRCPRDHRQQTCKRQWTKVLDVDGLVRIWWRLEQRYDQNSEAYLISYREMVRLFTCQCRWCPRDHQKRSFECTWTIRVLWREEHSLVTLVLVWDEWEHGISSCQHGRYWWWRSVWKRIMGDDDVRSVNLCQCQKLSKVKICQPLWSD